MAISGMGGYSGGGVGMQQLMRNESTSDSLAAMLGAGLQGVRHEEMPCGQKRAFFAAFDGPTVEDGPDDGDDDGLSLGGVEKKRRLTFDQVRSLERNFEMENKLEPERKMQLARELGLRPRQVAVWFQNRRARWKTKQLERDYESLAADYERLKGEYEQVISEKNCLKAEVQRLSGATTDCTTPALESAPTQGAPDFVTRHHTSRSSPTVDVSLAFKEETSGCSNSSDVLDADSPRTTDSSSPASEHTLEFPTPESSFPPPGMLQDVVKLEDGAFQEADQTCNYLLLQLDEQSVLPWWDWP